MIQRLILTFITTVGAVAQTLGPATQLQLVGLSPAAPTNVLSSYNGPLGNDTFFYWVVAIHTRGQSALAQAPALVSVGTLSATNVVSISWRSAAGALSYTVLRTSAPGVPAGNCGCAVASGIAGLATTDTGAALGAFTSNAIPSALMTTSVDNSSEVNPYVNVRLINSIFRIPLVGPFTAGSGAAFDARGNLVDGGGTGLGAVNFSSDGGVTVLAAPTVAPNACVRVADGATITGWSIYARESGTITMQIWKRAEADLPVSAADNIAVANPPALAAAQFATSNDVSGWTTTTITAGDWMCMSITGVPATITAVWPSINVTRP